MRKFVKAVVPPPVKKVTLPVPTKVLREFVGYGAYNLQAVNKCGPKLSGYHCTASWRVQLEEIEQSRFKEVAAQVGNLRRLFHGTPAKNIGSITRQGLQAGGRLLHVWEGHLFWGTCQGDRVHLEGI